MGLPEEVILSQGLQRLEEVHPGPDKILVIGKTVFTSILSEDPFTGLGLWCWLYMPGQGHDDIYKSDFVLKDDL